MTRVLVTGMSGTGKSTVLAELARRGHRVVDTDDDGWADEVVTPDGSGVEQLWREDAMNALLEEDPDGVLVVSGCVRNQGSFYDRFDAVVLLSAPVDVLLARIASRDTNQFGTQPAERERILADLAAVQPLLRATSTAEIDATQPLQAVADAVEALAEGAAREVPRAPDST